MLVVCVCEFKVDLLSERVNADIFSVIVLAKVVCICVVAAGGEESAVLRGFPTFYLAQPFLFQDNCNVWQDHYIFGLIAQYYLC